MVFTVDDDVMLGTELDLIVKLDKLGDTKSIKSMNKWNQSLIYMYTYTIRTCIMLHNYLCACVHDYIIILNINMFCIYTRNDLKNLQF